MILAERAARLVSEIAVERLKLEVARLRRERFGASSERSARIDQLELVAGGSGGDAGRDGRAGGCRARCAPRCSFLAAQARSSTSPRAPAARARRPSRPDDLRLLRRGTPTPPRRGRHRDPGADPGALGRDSARARALLLQRLRDNRADPGSLPSDPAGPSRPKPLGRGDDGQVRPAPAAASPEPALRP